MEVLPLSGTSATMCQGAQRIDSILSTSKPDATAERLKAIQDPQGKSRGRCVSPSISRQNIHAVRNGRVFISKQEINYQTLQLLQSEYWISDESVLENPKFFSS